MSTPAGNRGRVTFTSGGGESPGEGGDGAQSRVNAGGEEAAKLTGALPIFVQRRGEARGRALSAFEAGAKQKNAPYKPHGSMEPSYLSVVDVC